MPKVSKHWPGESAAMFAIPLMDFGRPEGEGSLIQLSDTCSIKLGSSSAYITHVQLEHYTHCWEIHWRNINTWQCTYSHMVELSLVNTLIMRTLLKVPMIGLILLMQTCSWNADTLLICILQTASGALVYATLYTQPIIWTPLNPPENGCSLYTANHKNVKVYI